MKKVFVLLGLFLSQYAWATVTNQTFTVTYNCSGSIGPYTFTFPISDATALTVTQSGSVLAPSAYSVTPVNNKYQNGGNVTLHAPCSSGSLVLTRNTPLTQTSHFSENQPVPMSSFESGLDKLTHITQELDGSKGAVGSCPAPTFMNGITSGSVNCGTPVGQPGPPGPPGPSGGSANISDQAVGVIPLATGPAAIQAQSHLNDGVTTAGTITSSEPLVAPQIGAIRYASQYVNPLIGGDGIANSQGPNAVNVADPSYAINEQLQTYNEYLPKRFPSPSSSLFVDYRQGAHLEIMHDPAVLPYTNHNDFFVNACYLTANVGGNGGRNSCHSWNYAFYVPGFNAGGTGVGGVDTGWQVTSGLDLKGEVSSSGITEPVSVYTYKYGIGDFTNYLTNYSYGGAVAGADEGSHPLSTGGGEASTTFVGTITTGGVGATTIKSSCTSPTTNQFCNSSGDGRYDLDLSHGISCFATNMASSSSFIPGNYTVDCTVTPSTAWGTLHTTVVTPYPVPAGTGTTVMSFQIDSGPGNTGQFAPGDLVCFNGSFHEQAKLTTVSGTGPWSVTVPLRKYHEANSWIMANGMCGNFMSFTKNEVNGGGGQTLKFPVDIIGSTDSHTIQYRVWSTQPTVQSLSLGSALIPASAATSNNPGSLVNVGGTVTIQNLNLTNIGAAYAKQATLTLYSPTAPHFVGPCINSTADPNNAYRITCTQAASTGESSNSGNIVAIGSDIRGQAGLTIYPGAEVLDVLEYDSATCAAATSWNAAGMVAPCNIGTHSLEANNVAWTPGDLMEQSHHASSKFGVMRNYVTIFDPINNQSDPGRTVILGNAFQPRYDFSLPGTGTGVFTTLQSADIILNSTPLSNYRYHGGTRTPVGGYTLANYGTNSSFNWGLAMVLAPDPPGAPFLYVGCPITGCTDPVAYYSIFNAVGNGSGAVLKFTPFTNALSWTSGWQDFLSSPIMSPTVIGRANGTASTLLLKSVDGGAVAHTWTFSAPLTGGGYTLNMPQGSGDIALTSTSLIMQQNQYLAGSSGKLAMGDFTNLVVNSTDITVASGSWTNQSSRSVITGGQTDPKNGTTASKIVTDGGVGNWGFTNATALSPSTTYCWSSWMKGDVGGETVIPQIASTGAITPFTLTTSWVQYNYTGSGSGTLGFAWVILSGSPVRTFYVAFPMIIAGACPANPVYVPTGAVNASTPVPAILTPTLYANSVYSPEFDNGTCTTAKTIAAANGNNQKVLLTDAQTCALTFTQPPTGNGIKIILKITQSSAGAFSGAISGAKWPAGLVPTITQTSGAVDFISCQLDGINTYCVASQDFR